VIPSAAEKISFSTLWTLNVFVGFVAIAVELLTMRALAPVMGTNVVSTSLVIGCVVLSLSFGYFLAARREGGDSRALLSSALGIAGFSLLIAPWILLALKNQLRPDPVQAANLPLVFAGGLLGALLASGPCCVAVGFCSPLILEAFGAHSKNTRKAAGQYFISGGLGSLLGALLPNVILIPLIGTALSTLGIGTVLLAFAVGFKTRRRLFKSFALLLLGLHALTASGVLKDLALQKPFSIAAAETAYQTLFVLENAMKNHALVSNMGIGFQSVSPTPEILGRAAYAVALLPFQWAASKGRSGFRALILGSGGGTTSSEALRLYSRIIPDLSVVNVDIDPKVHEYAKRYFSADVPGSSFVVMDARVYLKTTESKFDFIFLNAFANELFMPNQLISREFFEEVKSRLHAGGLLQINVLAERGEELFNTVLGAVQHSFAFVYEMGILEDEITPFSNSYLFASDQKLELSPAFKNLPSETAYTEQLKSAVPNIHLAPSALEWARGDDSVSSEWLTLKSWFSRTAALNASRFRKTK
jgi:spermidine synthase